VGLGLWNSIPGTLAVETAMYAAGIAVYLRATATRTGRRVRLWSFVAVLFLLYLVASFGPPPPTAKAVAWSGVAMWLLLVWAAWIDR
jgi:hypothetical protein